MANLTVRAKIILGFAAVILTLLCLMAFGVVELTIIEKRATTISSDSIPGMDTIAEIDSLSKEHYILIERYARSAKGDEKNRIEADVTLTNGKLLDAFNDYEKTIFTPEDRQLFRAMTEARDRYLNQARTGMSATQSMEEGAAQSLLSQQLDPFYSQYSAAVQAEWEYNRRNGEEAGRNIESAVGNARTGLWIAMFTGLLFSLVSGYLLIQAINRPLAKVVDAMQVMSRGDFSKGLSMNGGGEFGVLAQRLNGMASELTVLIGSIKDSGVRVNTSATEIAASAQQQLATANEVAATTSEVGAASKQISATSKGLMQSVKEVTDVAEKTAAIAGSGQEGLERIRSTMHQIMEASGSINAKLGILNEKAGSIGTVVTTITKVADQTNLLSLNAAIEAEKAGEYGRGFSVVASEIRRLADQSALATTDIEQMVKEIQSAISAGVMGMDKFAEEVRRGVDVVRHVSDELTQIINQVQTLTTSFETVNEGMQSQSSGAQQISEALVQLGEASRQTVESLRQSNQAIEQLNIASRTMQNGVSRFVLPA